MGLDMYLEKHTYIWSDDRDKVKIKIESDNGEYKNIKTSRIKSMVEEIAYWRKANQIHNWFVQHVQDGVDNCSEYYVGADDLKKLYGEVCSVLQAKDTKTAKDAFPPTSGCFFGNTDIDEFYWKDLERTKTILENLFKEEGWENGSYYYQASW